MPTTRLFDPHIQAAGVAGDPLVGASLYTYAGPATLTPQVAYVDSAGTTAATNPIVANAAGRWAPLYLDAALTYRVRAVDAAGNVIFDIVDAAPEIDDTPASGALRPEDFEAGVDDGVTDASDAIVSAAQASAVVRFSAGRIYLVDASVDLPPGTTLQFDPGAKLKITAGVTLFAPSGKVLGGLVAGQSPPARFFDCEVGGNIVGLTIVDPAWWGADGDATTAEDSSPAFAAAWDCLYRSIAGKTNVRDGRRKFVWAGQHHVANGVVLQPRQDKPFSFHGAGYAAGASSAGARLVPLVTRTFTATPQAGSTLLTSASKALVASIQDYILPGRSISGAGLAAGTVVTKSQPGDAADTLRIFPAATGSPGSVTLTAPGMPETDDDTVLVVHGESPTSIVDFDLRLFDVVGSGDPAELPTRGVLLRDFQSVGNSPLVEDVFVDGFVVSGALTQCRNVTLSRVQWWARTGAPNSKALHVFGGPDGFTGDIVVTFGSQFVVPALPTNYTIDITNDAPFWSGARAPGQSPPEVKGVRIEGVSYYSTIRIAASKQADEASGAFIGDVFVNMQMDGNFVRPAFEITSTGAGSLVENIELDSRYLRSVTNTLDGTTWAHPGAISIVSASGGEIEQVQVRNIAALNINGPVCRIAGAGTKGVQALNWQINSINNAKSPGNAPLEVTSAFIIEDGADNIMIANPQATHGPYARSFGAQGASGASFLTAYNSFDNETPIMTLWRVEAAGLPQYDPTGEMVLVIERIVVMPPGASQTVDVLIGGCVNGLTTGGAAVDARDVREIHLGYRNFKTSAIATFTFAADFPFGIIIVRPDAMLVENFVHIASTAGSNIVVENTQVAGVARTIVKDDRAQSYTFLNASWTNGNRVVTLASAPERSLAGWRLVSGGAFPSNTHVMRASGTTVLMSQPANATGTGNIEFGISSQSWDRNTNRSLN